MSSDCDVLILSSDATAIEAIRAHAAATASLRIASCASLDEVIARLADPAVAGVFVDIDPEPVAMLARLDPIINRHPAVRFTVISTHFSNDLMIEAMGIGVRHFLPRKQIEQELGHILDRLVRRPDAATIRAGAMVTVLSSGGGCGATTLAVNLARELADAEHPSLVMDLDAHYGAVATYLGLRGSYSLADLLHYRGELDPQLVATTAMEYDRHLHALLHPSSTGPSPAQPLDDRRLEAALEACRATYRWTVADAPRVSADLAARLARQSRAVLIITQLAVKELRQARTLGRGLIESGLPAECLRYVVNRHRSRRRRVSLEEAGKALDDGSMLLVRNDYAAAIESLDMGRPLADIAPRSRLRRDIAALADAVAHMSPPAVAAGDSISEPAPRRSLSLVG